MQNYPNIPWKEWAIRHKIVWRQRNCDKCKKAVGEPKPIFLKNRRGHSFFGLIFKCECGVNAGAYAPANVFTKKAMLQ